MEEYENLQLASSTGETLTEKHTLDIHFISEADSETCIFKLDNPRTDLQLADVTSAYSTIISGAIIMNPNSDNGYPITAIEYAQEVRIMTIKKNLT